ncbi:unnamed protein product [Penicillium glandicola]
MGSIEFKSPPTTGAEGIPYYTPVNNAGAALNPNDNTPTLFQPLQIRDVTLKNRIIVAPMCMFSSESDPTSPDIGALTDFHITHLGHLATKGVGLVMIEATAVQFNGRISPNDSGLWQDGPDSGQAKALRRLANVVHSQGAKIGIQLAHAGRKGSLVTPWLVERGVPTIADESVGGWPADVVAPTGGEEYKWAPGETKFCTPRALTVAEIQEVSKAFARSARVAVAAGIDVIEIHAAHGYLLHEFLSPVTNRRDDEYGGDFENRTRIVREVATAIRNAIPSTVPLFLRISATEWLEGTDIAAETGSWDLPSSIRLAKILPKLGVDLIDVSSGGNHPDQSIKPHKDYQVDLAGHIRREIREAGNDTLVGAVGLIREANAARDILQEDAGTKPKADVILMARQFLREPGWVFTAAEKLGVPVSLPHQFGRAGSESRLYFAMHLSFLLSALALGASVVAHPGGHHMMSRRELSRRSAQGLKCRDKVSQYHQRRWNRNVARRWHGVNTTYSIQTEAPYYNTIQNDTCVLSPEVTEGPYVYPPSQTLRQDMTEDQVGVPLWLDIGVLDMATCEPLEGVLLDLWHCNATGSYSSFTELSPNTPFLELLEQKNISESDFQIGITDLHTDDSTWLRGMWPTDKHGMMEMKTIFPGFYVQRSIHIHVQAHTDWTLRENGTIVTGNTVSTGQLYFDEALEEKIMALQPYASHTEINRTTNAEDTVYPYDAADGFSPLIDVIPVDGKDVTNGMIGYITIGVDTTAIEDGDNYVGTT